MIESFIELDYTSLRQTIWIGYLMTFILPIVTVYFVHKQYRDLSNSDKPNIKIDINEKTCTTNTLLNFRHIHRFFTSMRVKDNCDDSESSPLFIV